MGLSDTYAPLDSKDWIEQNKVSDINFAHWLSGFTDAEGSFSINILNHTVLFIFEIGALNLRGRLNFYFFPLILTKLDCQSLINFIMVICVGNW